MKVTLYAVYDSASGVYDGPVPGTADGKMVRSLVIWQEVLRVRLESILIVILCLR